LYPKYYSFIQGGKTNVFSSSKVQIIMVMQSFWLTIDDFTFES